MVLFLITCAQAEPNRISLEIELPNRTSDLRGILPHGTDDFSIISETKTINIAPDGKESLLTDQGERYKPCDTHNITANDNGVVNITQSNGESILYNLMDVLPKNIEYYSDRVSISCNLQYLFYYDDYGDGLIVVDIVNNDLLGSPLWLSGQNLSVVDPTGRYALLVSTSLSEYLLWEFPNKLVSRISVKLELDVPRFSGDGSVFTIRRYNDNQEGNIVEVYLSSSGVYLESFALNFHAISNSGNYLLGVDEDESTLKVYRITH